MEIEKKTFQTMLETPIGKLTMEATDEAVTHIYFENERAPVVRHKPNAVLALACKQLTEYFAGKRKSFDFPMAAEGTDFQQDVWQELLKIGYGRTRTYGELALAVKRPITAARGVGQACGLNPLPIVIPCHRVVRGTGELGGYRWGVQRKRVLLDTERASSKRADG